MRAYSINNFYLAGIHAGIQTAHCHVELANKYVDNMPAYEYYRDWLYNHKTMIVLNGGYTKDLEDFRELLDRHLNPYPWAAFRESEEALGGVLTNVTIVLPEKVYSSVKELVRYGMSSPTMVRKGLTQFEIELADKIQSMRLMA